MALAFFVYIFVFLTNAKYPARDAVELKVKSNKEFIRITWGSCFGQSNLRSDIFKSIGELEPDLFIWGGDATYTDKFSSFLTSQESGMLPIEHV